MNTLMEYKSRFIIFFFALFCVSSISMAQDYKISGELKKWHRIELTFDGPETEETDKNNPFLNYRMDVTFTQGDQTFVVPGFFAADGNAAETSSDKGNKWKVRFTPNKIGNWDFKVSFLKGENIAVADDASKGETAGFFDGATGSFAIAKSDKTGRDNRAKGRLNYVGKPYLQFEETSKYFIKVGVDAPENLLAFADFDATTNIGNRKKTWEPHAKDYNEDAKPFLWKGDKGKNLFGVVNYLYEQELNVFSFLTFSVDGDDRNVFPYILKAPNQVYEVYAGKKDNLMSWMAMFHRTRFDISKMEQWERIFEYAETKGMFLHFKTHETETDHLMDKGVFGTEGKLYYRELIARFGHHLVMNWNLGEENNQPIPEVRKVAEYVAALDPYKHHLVLHTFPNQDDRYAELVGDQSVFTGASMQLKMPDFSDVHDRVLKWRKNADASGKSWAIAVDEPGDAKFALVPDSINAEHTLARGNALWGTLLAGGYGVEWYFGYKHAHSDLTCEDYRSRQLFWPQNVYAKNFFELYLPFWEMQASDELLPAETGFCFSKANEVYAVYLKPSKQTTTLNIGTSGKKFTVKWYDPRNGGELKTGSVKKVKATGTIDLGFPPDNKDKDWVILVTKK